MSDRSAAKPGTSKDAQQSTAQASPRLATRTKSYVSGGGDAWAVHTEATKRAEAGGDVIILTIGDPDFDTPEPVVEAAIASLKRGETHYTPAGGVDDYVCAIAPLETHRLGREIARNMVVATQGAQNGLYIAMQTLVDPGDEVIVSDPAYPTFSGVIGGAGATMVRAPLSFDGSRFAFDLGAYEKALTPRTRAILFNFPHNPTGAVTNAKEARQIADFAVANDIWLIADEVYAEMGFEAPHVSAASFPDTASHVISVRSMSKSHAMAGWRCGWLVAPAAITPQLQHGANCMMFGGAEFIQRGAAAGLALDCAVEMSAAYRRRRDLVLDELTGLNTLTAMKPQSGVFMLLDVRASGLSGDAFAWQLLEAQGVAVTPADFFSPITQGFVRISLCVPDDQLRDACQRIAAFCRAN